MRNLIQASAVVALTCSPVLAQEFRADNDVLVTPVAGGFSVASDAGLGARGYWCAAADYARDVRDASGGARLYVAADRPAGIGQRSAVVFTLDPADLMPRPTAVLGATLSRPGSNLAVGHAIGFCADGKLITDSGR